MFEVYNPRRVLVGRAVHREISLARALLTEASMFRHGKLAIPLALLGLFSATPAAADVFFFSTGDPDGKIATASRPSSPGKFEIESADDFILTGETAITSSTFTGLILLNSSLSNIQ